jgi:hypothetical protein
MAAVAAGAAVIGAAIGALEAGDGAVPAGAGSLGAWDWGLLFPQAASTSVQAATRTGIFRFIVGLLGQTTDCRDAILHTT